MTNPNKLSITVPFQEVEKNLKRLAEQGLNIEIALYDPKWFEQATFSEVRNLARAIDNYKILVSTHGALFDLNLGSQDKYIREYSIKCLIKSIRISKLLKAIFMVFHTGFVPLIPQEGYKEWFKNCLASFKVLTQESQKQGVRLLVENFWEPYPEMIYDLIKKTRSGILKFCFDLGHFNIYSKAPLSQWLRLLAPETLSLHLHDNDGVSDEHLALGSGRVKFKEVIKKFLKEGVQPYINLEVKPKFISSSLKFIFEEKLLSE